MATKTKRKAARKHKTITVSFPHDTGDKTYRVERVTDSVAFNPGSYLDLDEVTDLCEAPDWTVTLIPK